MNKRDKKYIPKEYWQKKSSVWEPKKAKLELKNLRGWISEFCSNATMLEVGSGTGRVYNHLVKHNITNSKKYMMCDIADGLIERCKKNTGLDVDKWDGKKLPYPDSSFDLVISFSVLMWVPPEDIGELFSEHVRVCDKYIYIATWYADLRLIIGKSGRVFEHKYYDVFKKHNLKILKEEKINSDDPYMSRRNWFLEKEE